MNILAMKVKHNSVIGSRSPATNPQNPGIFTNLIHDLFHLRFLHDLRINLISWRCEGLQLSVIETAGQMKQGSIE
jgi:hypothetical protein